MNNKRKTTLAIILVVVVLLLGGAAMYIASQLSSRQAVAPNVGKPSFAACNGNICYGNDGTRYVFTSPNTYYASGNTSSSDSDNKEGTSYTATSNAVSQGIGDLQSTTADKNTDQYNQALKDLGVVPESGVVQGESGGFSLASGGEATTYSVTNPTTTVAPTATTTVAPTVTTTITPTPTYVGSEACTVVGCVASDVITCSPDCPTECGKAASTITTCTNSCGVAVTKSCAATSACKVAVLEVSKTAYKNEAGNSAGSYTLTTEMSTVSKSQTFVYSIKIKNTGDVAANGVTIKDSLKDISDLTFVDTVSGCNWNTTDKELTCSTSLAVDETKTFSFRVKAAEGIANGNIISNKAVITFDGGTQIDKTKDLTVSTVVGCNNTCTTDDECTSALVCDSETNKCRKAACLNDDDCTCTTGSTTTTTTTTTSTVTATATPTESVVAVTATPTTLPEAGIFNLPGIAAFGGGLLLAVIGILLAL
ncbi:MAG TPA: hypothetical protein VLH94_03190 [Spirochaetia bacterium]|nr:hypothetical protein [Spirochaetia bacterium]